MSHHLSSEDVRSFHDSGFLVVPEMIDETTLAKMHDAIGEITSQAEKLGDVAELEPSNPDVMRRIWSPSIRHAAFKQVQEDPRILDRLEGLIGPDIVFHHSKLNMKGPKIGSPVEWHQDMSYYPHTNSKLIACIIYLDDSNEENGCLHVLKSSHKQGILDHSDGQFFRGRVIDANVPQTLEDCCLSGKAGTGIFLHCKVLHRSAGNRTSSYRRVFIPAYRSADALPIYFGPHAAHNEPGTYLLRGRPLDHVTVESEILPLPLAEKPFNSLFAIQQGEHIACETLHVKSSGYATET
jgi:ectoine hydroxylase-related dioxygenase (phytanoyl-CoA dioxygenase family)